jgi:outer membrane protein assembly factor BamE (lipoprotein component of BamABCDE complex)
LIGATETTSIKFCNAIIIYMRNIILLFFIFSLSALFFTACATPQHQALRQIQVGMDKAEVLEKAGNPTRTARIHSQDRWTYEVENREGGKEIIYIFLAGGKVTHVGGPKNGEEFEVSVPSANTVAEPVPASALKKDGTKNKSKKIDKKQITLPEGEVPADEGAYKPIGE